MKFKFGDRVRVRPDLKIGTTYGSDLFIEPMADMRGKIGTIDFVDDIKGKYYLKDGGYWYYTDEMLMPAIPTFDDIRKTNIECVIEVDSVEEARELSMRIPPRSQHLDVVWCYQHIIRDYSEEKCCFHIFDGHIDGYSEEGFYSKNNSYYGEIYSFSDIAEVSRMQSGGTVAFAKCPVINTEINTLGLTMKVVHDRFKKEENNMMNFWTETGERYVSLGKHKGKTIPTTTTFVEYNGRIGSATCDTADYNERQGVLEALANSVCSGNFDRKYNAVKKLKDKEYKLNCTCGFCGKVCDSPEDKAEHEQWHIDRKKAKRERYLLRKRAKEIAFEQAAQEMAKTIAKENK